MAGDDHLCYGEQCYCVFRDRFSQFLGHMKEGKFADVKFRVGPKYDFMFAHSMVLSTASPKMWELITDRKKGDIIDMSHYNEDSFKSFLEFLYGGRIDNFGNIRDLYDLADKFDVAALKFFCDERLMEYLSYANAVETYDISDKYERPALKKFVSEYIINNMENVVNSRAWKKMEYEPEKVTDVFYSLPPGKMKKLQESVKMNERRKEITNTVTWNFMPNWDRDIPPNPVTIHEAILSVQIDGAVGYDIKFEVIKSVSMNPIAPKFDVNAIMLEPVLGKSRVPLTFAFTVTVEEGMPFKQILNIDWDPSNGRAQTVAKIQNDCTHRYYPEKFSYTVKVVKRRSQVERPSVRHVELDELRFSDVNIVTGTEHFSCHKIVLASSSEYFSKLFNYTQKEYRIEGLSSECFSLLKKYMYLGELPPPDAIDIPLLLAAKRLKLPEVVRHCCYNLSHKMTVDNALDIGLQTDEETPELQSACIEYLAKHFEVVMKLPNWPKIKNSPAMLKEVCLKICVPGDALPGNR